MGIGIGIGIEEESNDATNKPPTNIPQTHQEAVVRSGQHNLHSPTSSPSAHPAPAPGGAKGGWGEGVGAGGGGVGGKEGLKDGEARGGALPCVFEVVWVWICYQGGRGGGGFGGGRRDWGGVCASHTCMHVCTHTENTQRGRDGMGINQSIYLPESPTNTHTQRNRQDRHLPISLPPYLSISLPESPEARRYRRASGSALVPSYTCRV